ncbi:uncharacterized protein TRIVIDRAFT_30212 [Trichoderma virens Gv29-8]|jgi:hypothetical protein|uniref:Uncharacterized protein n=1 Tax=Hypocrea virens (strain Gv29-8 / FGSC 10586) TaxID=413071 RepID=G9MLX4_HYPVG|nr:uncharacterized protein TRIVIDRAFT_30212 [Trichoderma virens Gv29-8]EHK24347.1 hypothetical protein TRIVIDRAFT_30212 [Trichoderma virens Gv29-8]UKZ54614.1 hypothetical protein TrVGV298_008424 [Trichoderma virens]
MDKVTLLTASRLEPTVAIRPHSTIVARLGRAFAIPLQLHHRFKHISLFICLQSYFISYALLVGTRYACFYAFVASAFILKHGFAMSTKAIVDVWDSKSVQKVRARIFYEFAVFILGCGNALFLVVFWPGWLILGGACFALWQLTG